MEEYTVTLAGLISGAAIRRPALRTGPAADRAVDLHWPTPTCLGFGRFHNSTALPNAATILLNSGP